MSTLFFGGSFNPIHNGHLICARMAKEKLGFEKVVLVPSKSPPHKPENADLVAAEHRYEMCRIAVENEVDFEVNDLELHRTGPSFTIDTARQLRISGHDYIHWLIGADMVKILPHWHMPQQLLAEVHFHIMARPGWQFDFATLPWEFQFLKEHVVETPLIDISATEIRRRIRADLSTRYLIPDGVGEYIRRHELYR